MTRSDEAQPRPLEIAVAVVESDGRFLIGLRPQGVPLAGMWEFPGGKLEPGESASDAAVRECLEETGLSVTVSGEYPPAIHAYDHGTLSLRFFSCRLVGSERKLPARFRWVKAAELGNYLFPPANAELLELLARNLRT